MGEHGQEFVFLPIVFPELSDELFPLSLGLLAGGDVLDGQEDQVIFAFGGKAAGTEHHRFPADVLEVVFHRPIVERAVAGDDLLEQRLQCRDVPLPVSQVVDESAFRLGGCDLKGPVERGIRRPDVKLGVEDDERLTHRRHDTLGVFPGRLDEPLALPTFGDIAKDEDDAHDLASVIVDGGGTVVDGSLAAIPGDEEGMVAESDGKPSLDDDPDRLFDRLSGRLVDDVKDLLDLLSGRLGERPAGERLGDGIEVVDAAVGVGGDDAIADGSEGDLEPVPPVEDRVIRLSGGVVVGI